MPMRNSKCACGSGKKYKKCCGRKRPQAAVPPQPKPRSQTVEMRFPANVIPTRVRVGPGLALTFSTEAGSVAPLEAEICTTYERSNRAKPEKTISRMRLNPAQLVGDLNTALSRYDEVFAVDTNTKQIGGQSVAVVSVVRCRFAKPISADFTFTCWADTCF